MIGYDKSFPSKAFINAPRTRHGIQDLSCFRGMFSNSRCVHSYLLTKNSTEVFRPRHSIHTIPSQSPTRTFQACAKCTTHPNDDIA